MTQKGGTSGGKGAPSAEDIQSMIPENAPKGIRENIMNQLNEGGGTAPSMGGGAPQIDCAQFASAPSCSYVPESVRDQCERCKAN